MSSVWMRSGGALRRGLATLAIGVAAMTASAADAAVEIERVVSPGGIEAWLVEERAIPIISMEIAVRGGASREAPDEAGLAMLFAGMLEEGAGPFDAQAFAVRAEEIAARFTFEASRDSLSIGATMLLERRDETLELLRLALTEPRFDEDALIRVKAQMQSLIRQRSVDPDEMASRAFFSELFGDDPYGRAEYGSSEAIEAYTADDLRAIGPRLLDRSELRIGVVGAISAEELGPLLDQVFGGLEDLDAPALGPIEPADRRGVRVVAFDAPQTTVIFGHRGLARDDPDFIPAFVMNYVLGGGGFESRLMQEVREKRGLAYSVYSYLAPLDRAALYLGGVATANERVVDSMNVIREEWRKMAETGVSEEELEAAKRYLTGAFPLRFDSSAKIARFLVGAQLDELGIDYITRRNQYVEAVTVEDIRRVAARVLDPDALFIVAVGQPVLSTADIDADADAVAPVETDG